MSVDLPSSTEPQVTRRRSSVLEVTDTLAVLHRRLADAVVGPRLTALGDARRRDLRDDLVDRPRLRDDAARARHVADRAEAHGRRERLFVRIALDELRRRVEHPVSLEDVALVREVDRRQLELLARDVLP